MNRPLWGSAVALFGCLIFLPAHRTGAQGDAAPALPAVNTPAPRFALKDAFTGKTRRIEEFARARRPVALFFFCGCSWCAEVAREWAQFQRAGALPTGTATVIVYQSSESGEARGLIQSTGLDSRRTATLLDGERTVTDTLYHADPCPRVFVLDRLGKIRYVNTAVDEQPRVAPAALLTARALSALQESAPK